MNRKKNNQFSFVFTRKRAIICAVELFAVVSINENLIPSIQSSARCICECAKEAVNRERVLKGVASERPIHAALYFSLDFIEEVADVY